MLFFLFGSCLSVLAQETRRWQTGTFKGFNTLLVPAHLKGMGNKHRSSTWPSPKSSLVFFPPSWDPGSLSLCNPASSNMYLAADFANASRSCDTEQEWQPKQKHIHSNFFHISVTLNTSCIYHYIIKVYFHHMHKPVCEVASLLEETLSNEKG